MGTLAFEDVRKSYGEVEVIHGVNLDVRDTEFVALVGPSGCGKSTLLRMIAGLEAISSGAISIDGRVVNEVAPMDRDVAMVFQSYALYPHMTVAQNMGFALKLAGWKKRDIREQVGKAAAILGLEPYLERKPKELSGGQMQRVAMGRAIVRNPEIFLFDEPLSNLDAKLRVKVRGEIKALHQRLKTTTVYVTHDQVEAMTLADRLVVMNQGNVEQIGTPLELYDRPATDFVAGFIGTPPMNLFEGQLHAGENPRFVLEDGTSLPLPDRFGSVEPGAGRTTLGVRPEHLVPADSGWELTVDLVETMGNETHITGHVGTSEAIFVMNGRDFPAPGDKVYLSPENDNLHLFIDGRRLNMDAAPSIDRTN